MATAICRPACSPPDPRHVPLIRGASRAAAALALAAGLSLTHAPAQARQLTLSFERLEHPAVAVEDLQLVLDAGAGSAALQVGALEVGAQRLRDLRVSCGRIVLAADALNCRDGRLSAPGLPAGARLDLKAAPASRSGQGRLVVAPGEVLEVAVLPQGRLRATLQGIGVDRLAAVLPALHAWQASGRLDGRLDYLDHAAGARLAVSLSLSTAGFSSADGLHAAEGLAARLEGSARRVRDGWDWQTELDWTAGEAYLHPMYLEAGPRLRAAGRLAGQQLQLDEATLQLDGVRSIAARGRVDLATGALREGGFALAEADLAVIGPRYLAPLLAPAQAERLRFAGHASAGLEVVDGVLVALDAAFDQAGISLAGGELSFGPLSGSLPWRADAATEVRLGVAGGRWQKLVLGGFEVAARLHGRELALAHLRVPLLDGALVFDNLLLRHEPEGWQGSGGVVVEPLSMPLLTEALGLPVMAGVLSAALPGMRVSPGEIVLDGTLVVSVFGGYLQATRLRILEPFGVASHLYVDIDGRHLDLAQVTDTFSFGNITGQVDVRLAGLELVRWRPVRFDARVASSPGRYPRRISQRAVQNIGALGGAGAVAAIQRSLLGFFDSFGYREIGISCTLAGGVCLMGGLDDGAPASTAGYVLVRGGGIPALNVIGYNRRVDWFELIERLQRVIESNAAPVIR